MVAVPSGEEIVVAGPSRGDVHGGGCPFWRRDGGGWPF